MGTLDSRNADTRSLSWTGIPARLHFAVRQLGWSITLVPIFVAGYYFAYLLRFEYRLGPTELQRFSSTVVWVVAIKVALFAWFRTCRGWGRFLTFYDLVALIQAATASLLLTILVDRLFIPTWVIPRTVFLLDWGTTIVLIGGIQALVRGLRERNWILLHAADEIPAFIVGANAAGEALLRAIIRNGNLTYRVVGFLDVDAERVGTRIDGVPVVGTVDQTCQLAERHCVKEVLIVADALSGRLVRKVVEEARGHTVRVRVLPSYEQLIFGNLVIRPRPVSIDDLLRREPVEIDMSNIRQWLDERVLLVTGSAGSIGSEISRQLLQFSPTKIVLVDRSETGQFFLERTLRVLAPNLKLEICIADILDKKRMKAVFEEHRPNIIFHAAAYKHVPLMEAHPGEAVKNIVTATRQLAELAKEYGVESFVMISTDKAVNPTSMMGACKRAAEICVQSLTEVSDCRFVTVRFGNVLDSAGSVVQIFRQQINNGGPVTITDERMVRYFMTIPEAARLVIQAGTIGRGGEILLLDMGNPIRIVDLASDMIRLSGLEVGKDIDIAVVGLRPGEKLFEELHADGEKHLPTRHPKIVIADRQWRDPAEVLASIEQLERLADREPRAIALQLRRIVPEYVSPAQDETPRRRVAA